MQQTALYRAAKRGDTIGVRRLLSNGSDPNDAPKGVTALIAAATRGHTPIIRMLLDAGAQPDWYALQVAAFGNHPEAVRLLLSAGAPVDPGDGTMPLLNALKYSGIPPARQDRVRRLLHAAGAREMPQTVLRWRWSIRYGWRWRLRRQLYRFGWRQRG